MKKPKQFSLSRPSKSAFKIPREDDRRDKYRDPRWQKYRFKFLHYNRYCYICGSDAKHIDHIVSAVEHPEFFYNTNNHLPLCVSCHSSVTVMFDRIKPQKLQEKLEYIDRERKKRNITISVVVIPT